MELEKLASIFESVRVAPLRPTDLLVFRCEGALSLEQMGELHVYLEAQSGHARIVILTHGADLAILRPEEVPAAAPAREPPKPVGPEILPNGQPKRGTAPGAIA